MDMDSDLLWNQNAALRGHRQPGNEAPFPGYSMFYHYRNSPLHAHAGLSIRETQRAVMIADYYVFVLRSTVTNRRRKIIKSNNVAPVPLNIPIKTKP